MASRGQVKIGGDSLVMKTKRVGVMGATDWSGLGKLIIVSGSGVSHGITLSGLMGRWSVELFCLHRPGAEAYLKPG